MALIKLETPIAAPIERVFDLARSIDLHRLSMKHTDETAIAGRTQGLIQLHETVTWKAQHFGVYQFLTVRITALERPFRFTDVMEKGIFSSMSHMHTFYMQDQVTVMTDEFDFTAPLGWLGALAEYTVLKRYMKNLLLTRNRSIKRIAESDEWKKILL